MCVNEGRGGGGVGGGGSGGGGGGGGGVGGRVGGGGGGGGWGPMPETHLEKKKKILKEGAFITTREGGEKWIKTIAKIITGKRDAGERSLI